ncbi:DUF6933 domain-containing protein [Craterilacuibacter sp.]|uniref:DUF6933 domain-containing protein n=1 Tax=Craterilacuibacter sp. TaxID=2870909 RepID=UPI003F2BC043
MLLFRCSKDAAEALTTSRKGVSQSWVEKNPRPDDAPPRLWQLHAVTIARRPTFIAMQTDTRFAMMFWGLSKGDGETLLRLFYERLANHLIWLVEETAALSAPQLDVAIDRLLEAHAHFAFRAGSDRSVQTHINEVAYACKDGYAQHGCLPDNALQAASFERRQNQMLRRARGSDYFCPDEEFLCACLRDFADVDEAQLPAVRERLKQVRRQQMIERMMRHADESGTADVEAVRALLLNNPPGKP